MDPLILTAELDEASFDTYDALRRAHFPDRGYRLPAHVTLFHKLPGEAFAEIAAELSARTAGAAPIPMRYTELFGMGQGVAVRIEAPGLKALHRSLRDAWMDWLAQQDMGVHLHVTIQNKVGKEAARILLETLRPSFESHAGLCTGLRLWHYRGGPWEMAGRFAFGGMA